MHLEREFSGLLGTAHNNWSQNVVASLGCIVKVCGSGAGVVHAEIVHMDAGIFGVCTLFVFCTQLAYKIYVVVHSCVLIP